MRDMLKSLVMPELDFKDIMSVGGGVLQKNMLSFNDDGTLELKGLPLDVHDAPGTKGEGGGGAGGDGRGPSSSAASAASPLLALEDLGANEKTSETSDAVTAAVTADAVTAAVTADAVTAAVTAGPETKHQESSDENERMTTAETVPVQEVPVQKDALEEPEPATTVPEVPAPESAAGRQESTAVPVQKDVSFLQIRL